MDPKSEKLLEQIKQYYKSTETYENSKQSMHKLQALALGNTDKKVQKILKRMGVNVPSLLKETAAKEQEIKEAHKLFLSFERPPIPPGKFEIPPDPNVFDLTPPAVDGYGTNCPGIDRGLNLALAETNFQVSEQGDGWGWEATAGSPCYTTLVFQFSPPRAGDIQVNAYVDFKGQFAISANDHWWSNTSAYLTLSVTSKLYQHYWENGPTITLLDEDRTDSSNSGWIDTVEKLSYTTSISANDPILILVEIKLDLGAQSSYARVDVDFKTGAERRIRVPVIRLRYF